MRLQTSSLLALSILLSPSFALPGAGLTTHAPSEVLAVYTPSNQGSDSLSRPAKRTLSSRPREIFNIILLSISRAPKEEKSVSGWTMETNIRRRPKIQARPERNPSALRPAQRGYKTSGRVQRPQLYLPPSKPQVQHQALQHPLAPKPTKPNTETDNNDNNNSPAQSPPPHPFRNGKSGVIHMGIPLIPSSTIDLHFSVSRDVCTPLASDCGCLIDDLTGYILDGYPNGIALPPTPTPKGLVHSSPLSSLISPSPPQVVISETVRVDLNGREYRGTMTIRLSGQWRHQKQEEQQQQQQQKQEQKQELKRRSHRSSSQDSASDENGDDCSYDDETEAENYIHPVSHHPSSPPPPSSTTPPTQRDEFRLIIGLLSKTAKAIWRDEDVLRRRARSVGLGALEVRARVAEVDVHAEWVFYEVRRGVVGRCEG